MRYCLLSLCMMYTIVAFAQDSVTRSQIDGAEKMFGLSFTEAKKDSMTGMLTDNLKTYNYIHSQELAMKFRFRFGLILCCPL